MRERERERESIERKRGRIKQLETK